MKHNIVFKFLAVFLCAASLLGAVGSGMGIFAMTEAGLYQRSYDEAYGKYLETTADSLAYEIGVRYAATNLGGVSNEMADQYYGTYWYYGYFDWGRFGYVLRDENGNTLEEHDLNDGLSPDYITEIPVGGRYIKVLNTMTEEEYEDLHAPTEESTLPPEGGSDYRNNVPQEGADVHYMNIGFVDGSTEIFDEAPVGRLYYSGDNQISFESYYDPGNLYGPYPDDIDRYPTRIICLGENGDILYQMECEDGIWAEYHYRDHILRFSLRPMEEAGEPVLYDAIPPEGMHVSRVHVTYADGFEESVGGEPDIGFLGYDKNGFVEFTTDAGILTPNESPITYIAFFDNDTLVYEASDLDGVGSFTVDYDNMLLTFRARNEAETIPSETGVLEEVKTAAAKEAMEQNDRETLTAIVNERADLYNAPRMNADVIGYFDAGSEVQVVQPVTEDGYEWLWIHGGFILADKATIRPVEETVPETTTETTVPPETETAVTVPEETTVPEMTTPAETADFTETAVTEPVAAAYDGGDLFGYYDSDAGTRMVAEYTYADMPDYTVEIRLAEGALEDGYAWTLLQVVYELQEYLFPTLGICLLVFAVMAVYLCCAAGKKPGAAEIRAAGLNCIPLDLYFGIGCLMETMLAWLGVEGVPYLLRSDIRAGLGFALLVAFAMCLVFVAFCFACAAQFKTPGGYWWKNSLCARCLKLAGLCCRWLWKACVWLAQKCESRLVPLLVRCFRGFWNILVVCWHLTGRALAWLLRILAVAGDRLWNALSRFFSLLPLTWQWLVVGFVLVIWLFMAVAGRFEGMMVLWVFAALAIVLYGAHCFGTLLDAAKRMSKGDLDEKVDDKLLIGSFQDFAGELNGLADVAVVAAQKQLKSERMKTELITNVSHDIKTPLTSIINYVDLLQKPHTDEEQEMYLEVLDRQSQRLKKLIDDLMEMSKASTGNLAVDIQKVNAGEAIHQALGEFADKLEKAQLTPVFRQPDQPIEMMADGRLVWRVMSNLLGNAVKYALPGTRLYLDLAAVDGKVILSMKNISREELNINADELLERFVRGDASRNTEGSGLGLNIAQSLMQLQKGQLQILVDGDLFKVTLIFPGAE